MWIVDTALKARAEQNRPIHVGIIGAGFMCQGLTNQIVNSVPGMRVVAISNRRPERAVGVFKYAGCEDIVVADGDIDVIDIRLKDRCNLGGKRWRHASRDKLVTGDPDSQNATGSQLHAHRSDHAERKHHALDQRAAHDRRPARAQHVRHSFLRYCDHCSPCKKG